MNSITTQQPQQPQPQTQPKQADTPVTMQWPAKAALGQPQQPQTQPKKNLGQRFFRWYGRLCRRLGRTLVLALFFRFMFELAPSLKDELPKLYQLYCWGAEVAEKLYEFLFGVLGNGFRGEIGEFLPQVWEGIKELFDRFIALF